MRSRSAAAETAPAAPETPSWGAGGNEIGPSLIALRLVGVHGAAPVRTATEESLMKRVVPFIVLSIVLSLIVARLVATGRFDTIRTRIEERAKEAIDAIEPVVTKLEEEVTA